MSGGVVAIKRKREKKMVPLTFFTSSSFQIFKIAIKTKGQDTKRGQHNHRNLCFSLKTSMPMENKAEQPRMSVS